MARVFSDTPSCRFFGCKGLGGAFGIFRYRSLRYICFIRMTATVHTYARRISRLPFIEGNRLSCARSSQADAATTMNGFNGAVHGLLAFTAALHCTSLIAIPS
jgi:hypothetical protein